MAIDFSNYINTYKGSPVLQQQFPNMNDYLALFGYQGSTPSSATTSTTPSTPSTSSGVQGIINQNINQFQQGGGGGGIPVAIGSGAGQGSGLIGDFMTATQQRQNRLTNPGKVASFIGDFIPQQRDIGAMIRSGQVDTRLSSGLPLGISGMIAKALPDNYYNMSLGDQVFTQAMSGYTGPTVFGENTTGGAKDPFGLNVRSAFGNYAEAVGKDFSSLRESLTGRLSDKYGVEFDEETGMFIGANAKTANDMTKMMRTRFNFRKKQLDAKNRLDAQIKAAEEKRKADAAKKAAEEAARAAQYGATNYGRGSDGQQSYSGDAIGAGNLGFGVGATTGGPVSNRTGRGRQDYKKGGLATMFKLKG